MVWAMAPIMKWIRQKKRFLRQVFQMVTKNRKKASGQPVKLAQHQFIKTMSRLGKGAPHQEHKLFTSTSRILAEPQSWADQSSYRSLQRGYSPLGLAAAALQQPDSFFVEGTQAAGKNSRNQLFFGSEMIVESRQIHVGFGSDLPDRGCRESASGEEMLSRIEKALFGKAHENQTIV